MSSEIALGSICEIVMGQSPSGDSCNDNGAGTPLLNGPTEFGATHPTPIQFTLEPKKLCRVGDLLFCVRGSTTGRMNWADQAYAIGRGLAAIRGTKGYPDSYIRAVIEAKLDELLLKATGSTFPNVGKDMIGGILIPHLNAYEAQQVASIIQPLDDCIDLLRQTNTTLEAIAQAIFKSWFVDFDPVKAKAEGLEPVGMDAATAELFPSEFEESELGLIPKGWRLGALSDFIEINPKRRLAKGEVAAYLEMASVSTQGHRPLTPAVEREFGSGTKFINGDTLLARITPCLENGKTAFVDFLQNEQAAWGSTEFIVLRPTEPIPAYFAYLLARYPQFRQFAIQAMTGTSGRQRVEANRLSQYPLVLPSDPDIFERFGAIIKPLHQRIAAADAQAQTLANIRDTLLPRLISGKLLVPEVEEELEEALA